jgi:hypothetical protein
MKTTDTDHLENNLANWEATVERRQVVLLKGAHDLGIARGAIETLRRIIAADNK